MYFTNFKAKVTENLNKLGYSTQLAVQVQLQVEATFAISNN